MLNQKLCTLGGKSCGVKFVKYLEVVGCSVFTWATVKVEDLASGMSE